MNDANTIIILHLKIFVASALVMKRFMNFVGKIFTFTFQVTGDPRFLNYLLERISIALQRCNGACIFGTFGDLECDNSFLL